MEIIKAKREHIGGIACLESLSFSHPWSETAIEETMMRKESVFLVALSEGKVVGYIGSYYCATEGYITNIAVLPECRRKGAGRALLKRLIEEGGALGLEFLTLEVRESNTPAISLYESLGFIPVGKRPRFYSDPKEAALLLTYYMDASEGDDGARKG